MTTTNTTQTEETSSFNDAQLYWDGQDPSNAGWVLRWTDESGNENTVEVGGMAGTSIEALAHAAVRCAPASAVGDIAVYRGDAKSARISICDGTVMGWRAL